jgi:predicted permease
MTDGGPRRRPVPDDPLREVDRELRFHLEMRAKELEAEGLSPEDAHREAAKLFGDVEEVAAACRRERVKRARTGRLRRILGDLLRDVRIGWRALARDPVFTSIAILVLSIGIGAVVAVAGLVDAYLMRGLPFPESDRLVNIQVVPTSPDWREAPDVLELAVSWDLDVLSIVGDGRPSRAWMSWVTPTYFEAFDVRVQLGRMPSAADLEPGRPTVALISHGLWQRQWGGDQSVIGSTFRAYPSDRPDEAEVFTIIGVLPRDHWHVNRYTEVLSPLAEGRATYVARLASGVTPAHAREVLERLAAERGEGAAYVQVIPMLDLYVLGVRPLLLALAASVVLVLAIACGNSAVLLLVRAAGREREFALRSALGAGRGRLARQLVAEGLVLAAVACVLGVALGALLLRATAEVVPGALGTPVPGGAGALRLNSVTTLAAVAAGTSAALLFGLGPLAGAVKPQLVSGLVGGARAGSGRVHNRMRETLIGIELALSLSLLVGAGLLVRSASHLQQLPLGFSPEGITAINFSIRQSRYSDEAARASLFEGMLASVEERVPGVDAEIATATPFDRLGVDALETPKQPALGPEDARWASSNVVTHGYFQQLGIRLHEGRGFQSADVRGGVPVAVISRSLATLLWPGEDPIGQRFRLARRPFPGSEPGPWLTAVGVVDEVRKTLTEENPPDVYLSAAQFPPMAPDLVIRDPGRRDRIDQVREAVWSADPEIPLDDTRDIEESVAAASLPNRFLAGVLVAFAGFAAVLATLGLYGVVSYAVGRQRRDIAIRMALGARPGTVVGMFLRRTTRVFMLGLAGGIAGAFALAGVLRNQLHGMALLDLSTYASAAILLAVAALLATIVPAFRATRSSPMRVLGSD